MTTQVIITSLITLLVSSAWTPLVRKIPELNWVLIVIRAILAGVPTEPTIKTLALKAKKEEKPNEEIPPVVPPAAPPAA